MHISIIRQTMLLLLIILLSLTLTLAYRMPSSLTSSILQSKASLPLQSKASSSLSLSSTSSSSPSIQWEGTRDFHGLLTGFNRQSNITAFPEMYYTDKLNFTACKEEFYKENDILWRSFMEDIKPGESHDQVFE